MRSRLLATDNYCQMPIQQRHVVEQSHGRCPGSSFSARHQCSCKVRIAGCNLMTLTESCHKNTYRSTETARHRIQHWTLNCLAFDECIENAQCMAPSPSFVTDADAKRACYLIQNLGASHLLPNWDALAVGDYIYLDYLGLCTWRIGSLWSLHVDS